MLAWRCYYENDARHVGRGCLGVGLPGILCPADDRRTPPALRTATIKRGDLARTLSAKGTVKLEEVEVGAQVTGMIAAFGCDPADPGKPLDCGARPRRHGAGADRSDDLPGPGRLCRASILKARANLLQARAKCDQAGQEWKRAESLRPAKAIADSDYDLAMATFRMAAANVAVWEAAVQESEAAFRIAKTNLAYTIIKSPCDGVIMDRRVNVGQTVVAAFNAPGLFLIAKDSPADAGLGVGRRGPDRFDPSRTAGPIHRQRLPGQVVRGKSVADPPQSHQTPGRDYVHGRGGRRSLGSIARHDGQPPVRGRSPPQRPVNTQRRTKVAADRKRPPRYRRRPRSTLSASRPTQTPTPNRSCRWPAGLSDSGMSGRRTGGYGSRMADWSGRSRCNSVPVTG